MIEFFETTRRGTIGVRVSGTVSVSDYRAVMPEMNDLLAEAEGGLNIVVEISADADVDPVVLWDDMQFGQDHAGEVGRMAVVGTPQWAGYVEILGDNDIEARLFPPEQAAAAHAWAGKGG